MESFAKGFERIAGERRAHVAIVDARTGAEIAYDALADATGRAAAWLSARGLRAGDVLLSILPNSTDAMILFLGCMRMGVDYAPLPPKATIREVRALAKLVRPARAVRVADPAAAAAMAEAAPGLPCDALDLGVPLAWLPAAAPAPAAGPRAARILLSTSGTTGEPKAMVFDVDRLWNSARAFGAKFGFLAPESRFFNVLPMSYLGGLFNLGIIPFAHGASVAVAEPFSGRSFLTFWQDVERLDVNLLWFVPTMLRGLLAMADRTGRGRYVARDRHVRHAFLGTAPIDLPTKTRFEATFDIALHENFALSETTFLTAEDAASRAGRREGSVGKPLDYVEVRLGGRGDPEAPAAEIEVKSPYAILGYLGADGAISLPLTPDGFFRTGDLGEFAPDGQLVLRGRSRDIVKKGGLFVALREIEALAQSFEGVREACAVPVAHEFYGEDYVLFAIPKAGETLSLPALRAWLHDNLVNFKWPQDLRIVEDFPRTASGKVRKGELERAYAQEKGR